MEAALRARRPPRDARSGRPPPEPGLGGTVLGRDGCANRPGTNELRVGRDTLAAPYARVLGGFSPLDRAHSKSSGSLRRSVRPGIPPAVQKSPFGPNPTPTKPVHGSGPERPPAPPGARPGAPGGRGLRKRGIAELRWGASEQAPPRSSFHGVPGGAAAGPRCRAIEVAPGAPNSGGVRLVLPRLQAPRLAEVRSALTRKLVAGASRPRPCTGHLGLGLGPASAPFALAQRARSTRSRPRSPPRACAHRPRPAAMG